MKKIIIIFLSLALFTSWADDDIERSERANARIKTIYIYNFTKYIEWPKSYKDGKFVIGVLGSNAYLYDELTKMAISKTAGSQKIEVKSLSSAQAASQCHIVYVLNTNSDKLKDIVSVAKGKSILIVTDKPGMAKMGSGINFVVQENKQKIELNKVNIEKYNLKIASALADMAITVN